MDKEPTTIDDSASSEVVLTSENTRDEEAKISDQNNKEFAATEILPDQGYSWVILGAGLINFVIAFGSFNAFGVFQTYYLQTIFKTVPADTVAWISTVTISMTLIGGLAVVPMVRIFGFRNSALLGSVVGSVGLFLCSFATKVWHFVIFQGLIYGLASAIVVNVSILMVVLWFDKRKGFAIGLLNSGGGVGSLILVPTVTSTVNSIGIKWSFRILAIIYLVSTGIGCYFFKVRFPFKPSKKILDFSLFKDPFTILLLLSGFTMQIGYSVPLLYYPSSLVGIGKTQTFATNFIMVYAAISVFGRITSGQLTDTIGPINILIVCHAIVAVVTFVLWYNVKNFASFVSFYILFGLFGINFFSISPAMNAKHYPYTRIPQVNALTFLVMGLAMFMSVPAIGEIFQKYGHRTSYQQIIAISGTCYGLSFLSLVALRIYLRKKDPRYKSGPI
ncbi:hypothetical protein BB559_004158 [Furculomyces boomerangus]|uniref:Major facilitator superfamily (MFS) profile domain-containing protein n=2 Tax=Harpellales TaxID=61421 RepID=A0A2T9YGE2_9FUNG|nr:hypothetical protein BB559_004158 [Furculomyces boomerangus]PWA00098.1 hypothetical protein BB558_003866 [Smittium angustum]